MPNLQATTAAIVAEQRSRVLTAVLRAWHTEEVLSVAELESRLELDHTIMVAVLTELAAEGLVEQV